MPLGVSTQKNMVADFIGLNLNFIHKKTNLFLNHILGELGVTYALDLYLVGKRVVKSDVVLDISSHQGP